MTAIVVVLFCLLMCMVTFASLCYQEVRREKGQDKYDTENH